MVKESRTSFVNRVMRLSFGSTQGKYSYCNDQTKQVLFSLDVSHGEGSDLILSSKWSKNNYTHSLNHINKILGEGYELLIFKTKTRKNKNDKTVADGFEPIIERRRLVVSDGEFMAVPIDMSFEELEVDFKRNINKSLVSSREDRRQRLVMANNKPNKKRVSVVVYQRNPDVVAEVLYRAEGKCEMCSSDAPFFKKSDGNPYLEVHHKVQLSQGGDDTVENAIALCPNCHREQHFG